MTQYAVPVLPRQYDWLAAEKGPKVLVEALRLYGTLESPGSSDNPQILAWAKECGITGYSHDEIAWCGLFAAIVVKRAGYMIVKAPLWAANWAKWGNAADTPSLGDILVFKRPGGSHVGFYVGEDAATFHVLGGNQSDRVCITRLQRSRLVAARRSPFPIGQPTNVRRIILAADGVVSQNEA
jgi:uncharacterized protein (TIGR02594 family)